MRATGTIPLVEKKLTRKSENKKIDQKKRLSLGKTSFFHGIISIAVLSRQLGILKFG
jgi:hypothetical protein